ncbi:ribosome silencing factor [Undibacterium sp. CY18W]|uniref:Ribosomal silencing factor RsfS n=1 Tax=Undibacterium hunanense TaxID=2762292 RepID=A0ABR6ZTY8_9BURK|nr:ribosome silencing factor [Undibacterium hunanense]MBC3919363.1 ribosome silencing factor [Undibacterium hunanense]
MDIKKLQALVIDALEDVKAQDIELYETTHLTSLFDRVCIASGTSNRQTKALAASVRDKVKENGGTIVSMEGEATGEWVLVDLGDIVVHIMQPAIRAYYRLEELWGDKPVKFGAAKRITAKKVDAPDAGEASDKPKRAPRKTAGKAAPLEVTHDMMAIQTTLDDEKKPARKPRVSKTTGEADAKPARKPAARKAADGTAKPAKPAKIPTGGRVKVASTKTAVASAKQAAEKRGAAAAAPAKRATVRKKTEE